MCWILTALLALDVMIGLFEGRIELDACLFVIRPWTPCLFGSWSVVQELSYCYFELDYSSFGFVDLAERPYYVSGPLGCEQS